MKIGFLGTGLMGGPMAKKLIEAGYELIVYNRSKSKTESLKELGAEIVEKSIKALKNSDVIILMLSDYSAVCDVLFPDNFKDFNGKTIIQMSTISPDENVLLNDRIISCDGEFIEAPVLGSIPQIKTKKLFMLVGASEEQFNKWHDFLKVFGEDITHFGEVGKASAAKLALNQLIVSLTASFSMSLGYLRNRDVDIEKFMGILRGSTIYAPTFDKKLDKMLNRDFSNPNFPVKHLLKDVKLMEKQFSETGVDSSILNAIIKILHHSIKDGNSDLDYSALYNSIHLKR